MHNKRDADRVEAWLKQMALDRPDLIDGLVGGRVDLRGAWIAKNQGRIDDLLLDARDPVLKAAVAAFWPAVADRRVQAGLAELPALADAVEGRRAASAGRKLPKVGTMRVSWLLKPRNVQELYAAALAGGRSPNSVRRSVHRAAAELLAHHYGKARRNAVMAEVRQPRVRDERNVQVSTAELAAVLAECDPDFRDLVVLATVLAIDLTPLLRITPQLFHGGRGTLEVVDTKTAARRRTLELSTPALAILRRRVAGRAPDERIFPYTEGQVRHRWEGARDRAAGVTASRNQRGRGTTDAVREVAERLLSARGAVTLPLLRFKDLRHLLPTAWHAMGLPAKDLQEILGHAPGSKQTDRYITARVSGDRANLDAVAEYLGLARVHLPVALDGSAEEAG
jgi:hypothetical protein